MILGCINPIALRKAKIVSECKRVNEKENLHFVLNNLVSVSRKM